MSIITKDRIAAMNIVYNHHSLTYFLDSVKRIGFHCFELMGPNQHFDLNNPTLGDLKALKREVDARDLQIICVTPEQCFYPYNIASPDKWTRDFAIAHFKRYMEATAELGVSKMLCGPGWGDVDGDTEEAWKHSIESMHEMCDYAEKQGILLAFEILNEYESNLVHSLDGMKRIVDAMDSPAFKLLVDTVPVELEGKTLDDFFEAFGDQIIHIHMTDGDPLGHVPPGLGRYDMSRYFRTLEKYNYAGYVTIEICDNTWGNEPERGTAIGYETLCKALENR